MSEHTPTPWAVDPTEFGSRKRGRIFSVCKGFPEVEVAQVSAMPTKAERLANAALIVRAVNSHAALRAALGKIADEAEEFSHGDQNAQSIVRGLAAIARRALTEA